MADETLLQTFFTRLGFQADTKGLDEYKNKIVDLSSSLLKLSGVGALSLGGLFAFTSKATEGLAKIQQMSETYGIATNTIAAFNAMGRQFDITTESMQGGIANLSRSMGAASAGVGRLVPLLNKYHLNVKAAGGGTKDMQTFLGDVAERMQTLSSQEQVNLVTRLGLDPSMVRMLRNGREEFTKLYATASAGLPWKDEDFKKADEFEYSLRMARVAISNIGTQIGLTLMPYFQEALKSFLKWWQSNGEVVMARIKFWVTLAGNWAKNVLTFFGRFTKDTNVLNVAMKALGAAVAIIVANKLGTWAATAVESVGSLVGWIGRWTGVTKTLTTAQEAQAVAQGLSTAQIWLIVAGLAILIGLILLAIDDYETWRKGGESFTGDLVKYFKKFREDHELTFKVIKGVWDGIVGIWRQARDAWGEAVEEMSKHGIKLGLLKWIFYSVGIQILIVLAAVAALGGAFVWLAAKIVTVVSVVTGVFAEVFGAAWTWIKETTPKIVTEVGSWFTKIDEWGTALKNWFLSLGDQIGTWLSSAGSAIVKAFEDVFHAVVNSIKALFSGGIDEMINNAIGKVLAAVDKVKSILPGGGAALAGVAAGPGPTPVGGMNEYAPPILGGASATPLYGPNVGGKALDYSQSNSNNITQHNTINVNNGKEAADTTKQLQDTARKQQQQTLVPLQPVTI